VSASGIRVGVACLAIVALAGCASIPRDAGFDAVTTAVGARTDTRIVWNRSSEDDRAVATAVRELLAHDLSADGAVQIALLNNRTLQATYEDLGVAQADLVQAGLLTNPALGFEVRFPGRPAVPIELHIVQSFLELLHMPLKKRIAGAAFDVAKARVSHAILSAAADVATAFYRQQGAEQVLELRRTVVLATEASAEAAQRLRAAGNITDVELANERALHAQAKLDLAMAEAAVLDGREELNVLLGLWGADTGWRLAPRLPALPPQDVALAGLETRAIEQRLDLAAARSEIASLAQALRLAPWQQLVPTFDGGVHYEKEPDGTHTTGPSVDISIPIFDQGQAHRFGASARLRQAQQRYAALAVEIRSQVRRARNQLAAARARAEFLSKAVVPLRSQVVAATQLRYNAMLTGVFQLLQAKQAEIDAGRESIEALRDYWVASVALERAVGGRVDGPVASSPGADAPQAQGDKR